MMDFLKIREGGYVTITQKELVKGTFVRIQPHSKTFLDIHNPQAVLEKHLRSFSAMTKGIVFAFKYNDTTFKFNVLEVKPANAVSIIETDINVDFAPPLDYVEPTKPISNENSSPKIVPTIDENLSDSDDVDSDASSEEDTGIFKFPGSGSRISGKPVKKENNSSENNNKENKKHKTSMILGSSNTSTKLEKEKEEEKDERKFIAFSGEGYSLKRNKK
jgi:ubiquitin fusion degradation protein 1